MKTRSIIAVRERNPVAVGFDPCIGNAAGHRVTAWDSAAEPMRRATGRRADASRRPPRGLA